MSTAFNNGPFEDAMRAVAAEDTPENRKALYAAMLETSFLVPTEATPAVSGEAARIVVCPAGEQQVAVAFTHEDALRSWDENIPWIALRGAELFQKVLETPADEIAINPFAPEKRIGLVRPGGRVTRREIEILAEGRSPQDAADARGGEGGSSQPILISTPREMPKSEFFEALAQAAGKLPVVHALHFGQISYAQGETRRSVAVEFAPDASRKAKDKAIAAFSDALEPLLGEDEVVDFFGTTTPTGAEIAKTGTQFYTAKKN